MSIDDIVNKLHDTNVKSNDQTISGVFKSVKDIYTSISPASDAAILAKTSVYSKNWTFILTIDQPHNVSDGPKFISTGVVYRTILIGICIQNPLRKSDRICSTNFCEEDLNPDCKLLVTRKVKIARLINLNGVKVDRTISSVNYHHHDQQVWDEILYPTDVTSIYNKHLEIDNSQVETMIESTRDTVVVTYDASFSPRYHLRELLISLESAIANVIYDETLGSFGDGANLYKVTEEVYSEMIHDVFEEYSIIRMDDSYVYNKILAEMLDIKTLLLTTNVDISVKSSQVSNVTVVNTPCINSVFSSVVCKAVPAYLTNTRLSAISFTYDSKTQKFNPLSCVGLIKDTPIDTLTEYVKAFSIVFKRELVPIIFTHMNHFTLHVVSDIFGDTDVVLDFIGDKHLPDNTCYRENTILGGIISSFIGRKSHVINNAIQLQLLVDRVSRGFGKETN